jgi:SAM-dependent methyltransferase
VHAVCTNARAGSRRFPYQTPTGRIMTAGESFQRGLKQPIEREERSWLHLDNGFSSAEAMKNLHTPIVVLARQRLSGLKGNVLDLGCGNGSLLSKICTEESGLVPYGVDGSENSLRHATELLLAFAANFIRGDIFDYDAWDKCPNCPLTLLMIGRLWEANRPTAARLMRIPNEKSEAILAYLHSGYGKQLLAFIAHELRLELEPCNSENACLLKSS